MSRTQRNSPWTAATLLLVCLLFFLVAVFGLLFGSAPSSTPPPAASEAQEQAAAPAKPETSPPAPTPLPTLSPSEIADLRNCAAMLTLAEAGLAESAGQILPTIQDPYLCVQVATPAARLAIPAPDQPPAQETTKAEASSPTPTPNGFELAAGLDRLGQPDKAYEIYATAIAAAPGDPDAAPLVNQPWAIWKRLTSLFSFYQPLSGIAATLLLLLVAALALRTWAEASHYSLDIDKFTREGVKFSPEDFDPSNLLAAKIEASLSRMGAAGRHNVMSLIDGPLASLDLNIDLAPLPVQLGKVLTYLLKFIPKKQLTITGHLGFEADTGASLTIRIIKEEPRAKGIHAVRTFRQKSFDPQYKAEGASPNAQAYLDLAEVASIWIFFELHSLEHLQEAEQAAAQELAEAFGTTHWLSYALNHRAVKWIEAQQNAPAREALAQALELDPGNRPALYNLLFLDYQQISEARPLCENDPAALPKLVQAYNELLPRAETLIISPETCDAVQGNAHFLAGSIYLYAYLATQDKTTQDILQGCAEKHLQRAADIFTGQCEQQEVPDIGTPPPAPEPGSSSPTGPGAINRLFTWLLNRIPKSAGQGPISPLATPAALDPNLNYALPASPNAPDAPGSPDSALGPTQNSDQASVQVVLLTAKALVREDGKKTDLQTRSLIEGLERNIPANYSVYYNLACYYSQLAGDPDFDFILPLTRGAALEKALASLKKAAALDPKAAQFARGDPQLYYLAHDPTQGTKFEAIVCRPASPPLAELPHGLVRQEWLEGLAEQKILTRADLLNQGDSYAKRAQLAAKLRIWTDDLTRLVGFVDLLQIEGLEPGIARLLSLGANNRVESLKFNPPGVDQLRQELIAQNQRHQLVKDETLAGLAEAVIQAWLDQAAKIKPRLLL